MCPKGSGSVLTSLMMEALSWWEMTPCVRLLASTTSIWECLIEGLNPHERLTCSEFKEEYSLVGSFGSSWVQVFLMQKEQSKLLKAPWRFSKENEQICTSWQEALLLVIFSSNKEGEYYKILAHASWTHERARFSSPTQKKCSTRYQILQTWFL